MRTLIWIYIGIYALVWVFMCVVEAVAVAEEDKEPLWERTTDGVLFTVGFAGMLLYQGSAEIPALQAAWKGVAWVLVAVHGALSIKAGYQLFGPGRSASGTHASEIWGGAAIAAFLTIPSIWLNFLYAYR
jgi:hypothetical protein